MSDSMYSTAFNILIKILKGLSTQIQIREILDKVDYIGSVYSLSKALDYITSHSLIHYDKERKMGEI